jgi:class 3 adenylate cyclase
VTTDRAALAHLRHELRTPLNHIIGYSELLLDELGDGDPLAMTPALREIHGDAHEVLLRVNDFLSPARVESGPIDLGRLPDEMAGPLERIVRAGDALAERARQGAAEALLPDLARIGAAARRLRSMLADGVDTPAASAAARPGPPAADEILSPEGAAEGEGAGATLLVVDDNDENRGMLARRLARLGYRLRTAAGGREALAVLAREDVDLVLLDVMMPDIDGYEVLRRIKEDQRLRDIPVLMISALDELDSVVRCIELGADDYLPKPFDPVLLRARIGACVEKKRLRDQEARHRAELAEWNRTLQQRVAEQVTQMERLGRLKRFFSPKLAELIVAGGADDPLRSHRREVTVVFLDLRGFTAFTEKVSPDELMTVLREYHTAMGKLIMAHEGTLERFTGDGMMVFFNDPVQVSNPTERAIRMAVAMRREVARLGEGWRRQGYDLEFGVGLAYGDATIGAIGFEGRWDYGAIGSVTNLAARLCGEAKPGQILVSRRALGGVESLVDVELVGEVALKGFRKPVTVFNILGLRVPAPEAV